MAGQYIDMKAGDGSGTFRGYLALPSPALMSIQVPVMGGSDVVWVACEWGKGGLRSILAAQAKRAIGHDRMQRRRSIQELSLIHI